MRRKEREITDKNEIEAILKKAQIVTLALNDGGTPYAVPLNFGYREGTMYIHSALEGRKIDILKRDPKVAFSLFDDYAVVRGETACHWGARYRSVLGTGSVRFITDAAEKRNALDILLSKFTEGPFVYDDAQMPRTCTFAIDIASMSGKQKI